MRLDVRAHQLEGVFDCDSDHIVCSFICLYLDAKSIPYRQTQKRSRTIHIHSPDSLYDRTILQLQNRHDQPRLSSPVLSNRISHHTQPPHPLPFSSSHRPFLLFFIVAQNTSTSRAHNQINDAQAIRQVPFTTYTTFSPINNFSKLYMNNSLRN